MTKIDFFKKIVNEIHTSIIATVDEEMKPVTCVIDMMDFDDDGLYFLTAKGKSFYKRLITQGNLAMTLLKGEDTMSSLSINIKAEVKDIGSDKIDFLFEKNQYMKEIYPTKESRKALTVFYIFNGTGELFDLSKKPIERESFSFGNSKEQLKKYIINNNCIGCGECVKVCPQNCIVQSNIPFTIHQNNCLNCGNCLTSCQFDAVEIK